MKEQALVRQQSQAMQMQPLDTDIIVHQYKELQRLYKTLMQKGVHYGAPFPGSDKQSLLKPGAELICALYQIDIQTEDVQVEDLGHGHREYVVKSIAYHRPSGTRIGSGEGSASTMESKYRYRQAQLTCPKCGQETIIKGKQEYGGGWLCFAKKGGCGQKFTDDDKKITGQPRGRVENPDIADQYNTVLKMAKKRSAIDCVLWSTAASSFFTQDGEDQHQYSNKDFPEVDKKSFPEEEPAKQPTWIEEVQSLRNQTNQKWESAGPEHDPCEPWYQFIEGVFAYYGVNKFEQDASIKKHLGVELLRNCKDVAKLKKYGNYKKSQCEKKRLEEEKKRPEQDELTEKEIDDGFVEICRVFGADSAQAALFQKANNSKDHAGMIELILSTKDPENQ